MHLIQLIKPIRPSHNKLKKNAIIAISAITNGIVLVRTIANAAEDDIKVPIIPASRQ